MSAGKIIESREPKLMPAGILGAQPVEEPRRGAELNRMLEEVRKKGLAAYAKEKLPIQGAKVQNWFSANPKLLVEFETDLRRGNIVLSSGTVPTRISGPEQFNSMLSMWIGARYAASKSRQAVPRPLEAKEPKKGANLAVCAESAKMNPGPAALISLTAGKNQKDSAPALNARLAFVASPWLEKDKGIPNSAPQTGPTMLELQDKMKSGSFDTEFFTQYLMRMNSISSPEVRAKISNIFLRLGAIVKDNPKLAFSDFVGKFVVEMNHEFGSTMAFGVPRRPAREQGKKSASVGSSVPKKTSGGGPPGKPPSA